MRWAFWGAASLALAGCASPLSEDNSTALRRSIVQSAGRELVQAQKYTDLMTTTRDPQVPNLGLKPEIRNELERTTGLASFKGTPLDLGPSLLPDGARQTAPITLERAIASAVANNLDVQFARLAPAIAGDRVVAAEAAFDWVMVGTASWNSQDEPRISTSLTGGVTSTQQQVANETFGFRRRLTTGGQFLVQQGFTYTDSQTPQLLQVPDPAYEPTITLQLDQPLLRNFGSDVALAQVRLAQNAERDDVQQLKATLIKAVADTEDAYWNLALARHQLKIFERLWEQGEDVRRKLEARRGFDVKQTQYTQALSAVQSRKAQITRAQRSLTEASNRLKQLINDPEWTIGSETLLLPADVPIDAPVQFNLADAAMLALQNRPEIQRAIISIDDTAIRLQVADNARLPLLDLRAQTRFSALGDNLGNSYDNLLEGNFVNFLVSLNFEAPIGNRAAEAEYGARRLEQNQAVIAYRAAVTGVVGEVKTALTQVVAAYTLIEQSHAARLASAEDLRALQIEVENLQGYTPESLDRTLRSQERLAASEQEEIQALLDYNTSLSRLFTAMGTSLERNRITFDVPNVPQTAIRSPFNPFYSMP
ncbi:MAG: TolC family protein [Phycisphaeraceae bacterium]|nr:TolC family protein [Phycisphaeraceae bacterium]